VEIIGFLTANASTFLFVMVRTNAILMAAPIYGAFNVPMPVKAGFGLLLSLILTPLTAHVPMPEGGLALALSIAGEIVIGASIGLAIRFVFTGIEFAGQLASFQMGLGMAQAYDPINSAQITVIGKMMSILTILTFLSLNGHLMMIMALKRSFDVIPPYGLAFSGALMENMILFSKEIFILAVKFAAPVVAILIFINAALGIMARIVPQLNMFAVGFAVTIPVGLLMLALSMPVMESAFRGVFDSMWQGVDLLLRTMPHG